MAKNSRFLCTEEMYGKREWKVNFKNGKTQILCTLFACFNSKSIKYNQTLA